MATKKMTTNERTATAMERTVNNLQAVIDDLDVIIDASGNKPQAQILKGYRGSAVFIRKQVISLQQEAERREVA